MGSLLALLPVVLILGEPQQAPPDAATSGDRVTVTLRVEQRSEWFDYHIENLSNIEPGPLVPHNYEQEYDADGTWIFVEARYRLGANAAATEIGVAPTVTRFGSDIDTFFQPSGDVITSGTRGDVRLTRFSIQQWFEIARLHRVRFDLTGAYRRSTMDFLPALRIVTHSRPPSETEEPVGADETTWSHVWTMGLAVSAPLYAGRRWQTAATIEVTPLTLARLDVSLPLKYPGEIISRNTFGLGARGRLSVEYRWTRFGIGGAVTVGGVSGYSTPAHYQERLVSADFFARLAFGDR